MKNKDLSPLSADEQRNATTLFNDYKDMVYNHALRVVKNEHDAEDVTTEVFIKVMYMNSKDSTRFNPAKYGEGKQASEATWIHTITNSVILDFFRTNHQEHYKAIADFADNNDEEKTYFNFVAPENYKADAEVLTSELHGKIAKAFRTLKPKYRKIAVLYFLRDLPYVEIAEIVNIPMGTVKGMISRARTKLQAELGNVYNMKEVNVQSVEA